MRTTKLEGRAQAEDPQPFRCVTCGEAVSMIRRTRCACVRAIQKRTDLDERAAEIHRQRLEAKAGHPCRHLALMRGQQCAVCFEVPHPFDTVKP